MNKLETKIKELEEQLTMLVKDDEEYQETIIKLSKRIDKAIEYIEKYHFIDDIRVMDIKEYKELLDILKGSDKNGN